MFLVPSRSRAVDPYLQTLLPRVSLSRFSGKHRQLARQVVDSASSSANLMAGSSDANNVPKSTTLVFGSWACMADGSGGFPTTLSQLTRLNQKPPPNSPTSASLRISTKKEFYPNSTRTTQKTCQLQLELSIQSSSTQTLIPKNSTFPKLSKNT